MASPQVKAAVSRRLAANWTTTPIAGLNLEGDTPADGSAFLAVQYPIANRRHVGMAGVGNRSFREEGIIRFVLNIPRGQGTDLGDTYAETLGTLFLAAQFSGITCAAPSPPVEDDSNDNGNYYVLTFVVDYWIDTFA